MESVLWLVSMENRAWFASILNVLIMADQLRKVVQTKDVKALSLPLFIGFIFIQFTFMEVGFRSGQLALGWGMLLSLFCSVAITILIFRYRGLHERSTRNPTSN